MPYASIEDVKGAMAKWTLDANSKPTENEAISMIRDVSLEIDAVLGGIGLATPATAPPEFVVSLKLLNQYGATARILRSMFPDAAGPGETPAYAFWERNYDDGIKALKKGEGIPSGVATTASLVKPQTYLTRNPDKEETLGDIAEPFFKAGKEF